MYFVRKKFKMCCKATKTGNLCIGHSNIQGGLGNLHKSLQVKQLIQQENLDICCLNETNLNPNMSSDTLNLPQNFDFLRRDRPNDSSRGGCGILINKFLKYKDLGQLESFGINTSNLSQIEAQWIHLTELDIYICSFYRSEQFCPLDIFLSYYLTCMLQLSDINGTKKVMWI